VHAARHAEGAQPSQSRAAQQLRAALQSGDLARIAVALRALAQARGIPARSLGELAARVDDPAQRKALRALEAARFGAGDGDAALALLRAAFNGQPLHATGPAARAPATDA